MEILVDEQKAPKEIWLYPDDPFPKKWHGNIAIVEDTDVKYIRADIAEKRIEELEEEANGLALALIIAVENLRQWAGIAGIPKPDEYYTTQRFTKEAAKRMNENDRRGGR